MMLILPGKNNVVEYSSRIVDDRKVRFHSHGRPVGRGYAGERVPSPLKAQKGPHQTTFFLNFYQNNVACVAICAIDPQFVSQPYLKP